MRSSNRGSRSSPSAASRSSSVIAGSASVGAAADRRRSSRIASKSQKQSTEVALDRLFLGAKLGGGFLRVLLASPSECQVERVDVDALAPCRKQSDFQLTVGRVCVEALRPIAAILDSAPQIGARRLDREQIVRRRRSDGRGDRLGRSRKQERLKMAAASRASIGCAGGVPRPIHSARRIKLPKASAGSETESAEAVRVLASWDRHPEDIRAPRPAAARRAARLLDLPPRLRRRRSAPAPLARPERRDQLLGEPLDPIRPRRVSKPPPPKVSASIAPSHISISSYSPRPPGSRARCGPGRYRCSASPPHRPAPCARTAPRARRRRRRSVRPPTPPRARAPMPATAQALEAAARSSPPATRFRSGISVPSVRSEYPSRNRAIVASSSSPRFARYTRPSPPQASPRGSNRRPRAQALCPSSRPTADTSALASLRRSRRAAAARPRETPRPLSTSATRSHPRPLRIRSSATALSLRHDQARRVVVGMKWTSPRHVSVPAVPRQRDPLGFHQSPHAHLALDPLDLVLGYPRHPNPPSARMLSRAIFEPSRHTNLARRC